MTTFDGSTIVNALNSIYAALTSGASGGGVVTQPTASQLNATATQGPAGASAWKVDGSAVTQPVSAAGNGLAVSSGGAVTTAIPAGTTGNTVIKAAAGRLARVLVTSVGVGSLQIFDNATTNSGTMIGVIAANAVAGTCVDFQMPALNGITAAGGATTPGVTVSWT